MIKKKILYLSPVSFIGGAEESLSTLIKFLDKKVFEPFVIMPSHGPLEQRLLNDKVKVKVIPWGGASAFLSRKNIFSLFLMPFAFLEAALFLFRVKRFAETEAIDIIHTNGLKCHFIGGALGFCKRIKVIWHIREIYTSPFIKFALKFFKKITGAEVITISNAVKKNLGIGRARVIHNGVDTGEYFPFTPRKNLKEELGFKDNTKIITIPGILTPWKGQHIFLEAIAALKGRFPDIAGVIVGEELYIGFGHKGYLARLKDKAKKLEISDNIRFLGFRKDIPYILNSSLAVVHASIKPEPFGRVLIEAMACGKPVVAARGGAVDEIIRNGRDGIIVERGSVSAITDAVTSIIESEDMAENIGRKGRKRVEEFFSAEKMAKETENFYEKVLEGGRLYSQR